MRTIANRQLYTFILNAEDSVYAKVRPAFDALIIATSFSPPNTGADLLAKTSNRWIQREYKFAVDSDNPFACPDPALFDEASRLNAFAVFAFCAEITLLPGHCAPRFTPVNATAHTTPSRSTIVPHI